MALGVGDISYFIPWSRPANNHNYPFQPVENPLFLSSKAANPCRKNPIMPEFLRLTRLLLSRLMNYFKKVC